MFTGIIEDLGRIQASKALSQGLALEIACQFENLTLGESIAVDGACLTVTQKTPQGFWCEISPETLALTLANQYQVGSWVNLERALCLGSRLGGHWVTGHVDSKAKLESKSVFDGFWKFTFSGLSENQILFLVSKGSVAVNGVSLTINAVLADGFEVMLIPHTLEKTNLKLLEPGDEVNLELDWMSKLIVQTTERFLKGKS